MSEILCYKKIKSNYCLNVMYGKSLKRLISDLWLLDYIHFTSLHHHISVILSLAQGICETSKVLLAAGQGYPVFALFND